MAVKRDIESKDISTHEQMKRKAVVTQMLAEREQRQKVSREEIKRMRGEGRY